jgi:hypothetical protein
MAQDVSLKCSCGKVRCTLHNAGPENGDRFVCYCSDCRDFIRLLWRENDGLNDYGGVSVFHTRVGNLELVEGREQLASLHMTDKPLTRWYSQCCNTPFFSTSNKARKAFLSVNTSTIAEDELEQVIGEPTFNCFAIEATKPNPPGKSPSLLALIPRIMPRILKDSFGEGWRKSPLFDPQTHEPISTPRHLTPAEKQRLGRS